MVDLRGLSESLRQRVVASATGPFQHAPYPLARTLAYRGRPGTVRTRLGELDGDRRCEHLRRRHQGAVGAGGASRGGGRGRRPLPLSGGPARPVVSYLGVRHRHHLRRHPRGRACRGSGAAGPPDRGRHSHRGKAYTADTAEFAAWVHNALTDSFLATYQTYAPTPLAERDADRFVEEQTKVGRLLGADPLPTTARELRLWMATHPQCRPVTGDDRGSLLPRVATADPRSAAPATRSSSMPRSPRSPPGSGRCSVSLPARVPGERAGRRWGSSAGPWAPRPRGTSLWSAPDRRSRRDSSDSRCRSTGSSSNVLPDGRR